MRKSEIQGHMQGLNTEEKGLEIRYEQAKSNLRTFIYFICEIVIIISDYHYTLYVHLIGLNFNMSTLYFNIFFNQHMKPEPHHADIN